MLAMLQDLVQHKNYANAALLKTIAEHETAAADPELRRLLHHIIVANRFWLALLMESDFDVANESALPESFRGVVTLHRETFERESRWMAGLRNSDLAHMVVTMPAPGEEYDS